MHVRRVEGTQRVWRVLWQFLWCCSASACVWAATVACALGDEARLEGAIEPADPKLGRPVEFERDVLPILDAKCLACHNLGLRENGLSLEDVAQMLKGGKRGPAVVAGDPGKSRLFQLSARAAKPAMPPLPNKVEAAAVTPQELGILKQWILEGAKDGELSGATTINWHPLPAGVQPIYAVALTSDGQFAAAGRGNKVVVYHVPTGELVAELADPALASIEFQGRRMYEPGSSHRDFVQSLAFDPAGTTLASGSFREVKLWTRPESVTRLTLNGLAGPATAVAVSPDDQWLAVAAGDFSIRLFQVASGQHGQTLAGHTATVTGLAFSHDGKKLYSSSHDKTVRGWNLSTGAAIASVELPAPANALAATPDDARLVVGCGDHQWRVLTLSSSEFAIERTVAGHAGAITSISAIPPNGVKVVTGSEDGTLRVWDLATGNQTASLDHGGPVAAVAVSAGGQRYASADTNGVAKLWNAARNELLAEWKGDPKATRRVAELAADDKEAEAAVSKAASAIAAAEKSLAELTEALTKAAGKIAAAEKAAAEAAEKQAAAQTTYDEAKKAADEKKDDKALKKAADEADKVLKQAQTAAKMAADEKAAAIRSHGQAENDVERARQTIAATKTRHVAAIENKKSVGAALEAAKSRAAESVKAWRAIVFSRDGKELACAGDAGAVHTFDGTAGVYWASLEGHTAATLALAYAGPRSLVSTSADQSARVWGLNPSWNLAGVLGPKPDAPQNLQDSAFVNRVLAVAFSPDGALLATGGGDPSRSGELMVWNVKARSLVRRFDDAHSDTVMSVEFSHDGRLLLSGAADKFVKIHDVATGSFVRAFEGHTNHVLDVAWRHGDGQIASAGADNAIKIWDAALGEQNRTIAGYNKQVTSLQFIGRGPNLVSCSGDKTIRIHAADSGKEARTFAGCADFMYSVAASADEKIVVAGGQDGLLHVWNGSNGKPLHTFGPPHRPHDQRARAEN